MWRVSGAKTKRERRVWRYGYLFGLVHAGYVYYRLTERVPGD